MVGWGHHVTNTFVTGCVYVGGHVVAAEDVCNVGVAKEGVSPLHVSDPKAVGYTGEINRENEDIRPQAAIFDLYKHLAWSRGRHWKIMAELDLDV